MVFSLVSEKRTSKTASAKAAEPNYSAIAGVSTDASVGSPDAGRSEFVPAKCLPIYWEEEISDPVDLFDKDGTKTGHKIVTTGAGYTITNIYDLAGTLTKTAYQSVYGDWSETLYEYAVLSADGQKQNRVTSSGKNGDYTWSSYELRDDQNNLIESVFENNGGYKSSTQQAYTKSADGTLEKISVTSTGTGVGYQYESFSEYDANWALLKSSYSDGNGYRSNTERTTLLDSAGAVQGYKIVSSGSGPDAYWYESTETLDSNNNLVSSNYKDSSGYFSQRSSVMQEDPVWGKVVITTDTSGNGQDSGKPSYTSTAKYTPDWHTVESEHSDSYGYSSKLTTTIKSGAGGETIYSQTYQFKYLDSITSEWTNDYTEQWWPIVDGKPVEQPPIVWKTPIAASSPAPGIMPVVDKTAVSEFQASAPSSSDRVSEKAITGVARKKDKLKGSDGDDVFIVNDRADKIIAGQEGDSDSVMTEEFSLDLRARTWDGIENAMLAGSRDLDLTGDADSNILSGNGADNVIRGGTGADTLFGGGGKDIFVIAKEKTIDKIIDFMPGTDKIALSGSYFKSLFNKDKHLKEGMFGEKLALDKEGVLWFDTDGGGPKAALQIAIVGVADDLNKSDFIYI